MTLAVKLELNLNTTNSFSKSTTQISGRGWQNKDLELILVDPTVCQRALMCLHVFSYLLYFLGNFFE